MRIELLGTGGYHPNERRQTACLLLPELGIAFDAGTAAFRIAPRARTDHLDVFLTHAHLDHVAGLTFLLVPSITGQFQRITLHAAPAALAAVRDHLFHPALFPVPPFFEMVELPPCGRREIAGASLAWQELQGHPGRSMAYRLTRTLPEGGARSLAYVTDTLVDGSYTDFVRGVDLLIHECYFPETKAGIAGRTGHSHAREVAELARDAQPGRMLLVHLDPYDASDDPVGLPCMRAVYANVDIAEDGMVVEL